MWCMAKKVTQTRLAVPMTQDMRDEVDTRWRHMSGVKSAADYVRRLVAADLASQEAAQ